ncbi:MAG: rRNA adenine N-6-methyltransferase family protein [Pseudomonadota bacterium]
MADDIETARRWFAEDLRAVEAIGDDRVIDAFARVPRERFLGPGPWRLHSRLDLARSHDSPDADPRHLYHDALVTIDAASGINNGLPSLWAMVFDALGIVPGETVLQVGAGVGYYTAILAELVGPDGQVVAYEVEDALAARAQTALSDRANVRVLAGTAVAADLPETDVVVAFAGVTHVPEAWLSRLQDGGRMALPVTGASGWGVFLHLTRSGDRLDVQSLGPCGFYPCAGARRDSEAAAWDALIGSGRRVRGDYRLGTAPNQAEVLIQGDGWWIAG